MAHLKSKKKKNIIIVKLGGIYVNIAYNGAQFKLTWFINNGLWDCLGGLICKSGLEVQIITSQWIFNNDNKGNNVIYEKHGLRMGISNWKNGTISYPSQPQPPDSF